MKSKYKRKIIIVDKDFQMRFIRKFMMITLIGAVIAMAIILVLYYFTYRYGGKHYVRYLVEVGLEKTDVNSVRDNYGRTPLHTAIKYGQVKTVKYLIERIGADIRKRDAKGYTALHIAIENEREDVLKYILSLGIKQNDVNSKTYENLTPLIIAVQKNNEKIVFELLAYGANKESKDKNGKNALDYAKEKNYMGIIKLLAGNN